MRRPSAWVHLAFAVESGDGRMVNPMEAKGAGRTPSVLFVCVHNAGRSQMAAALLERHAGGRVAVRSAGSEPADRLNPAVVEAMAEVGLDIATNRPRLLDPNEVREADVVVTMGCGDACPVFPGVRYEDWELPDPSGLSVEGVRPIRDAIEARVRTLLDGLVAPSERIERSEASGSGRTVK